MSKENTDLNLTPSFKLFDKSYALIKKNFRIFAILYAIPVLYSIITIFTAHNRVSASTNTSFDMPTAFWVLLPVIILVATWIFVVYETMLNLLNLKVTKSSEQVGFKQLYQEARPYLFKFFILGLLISLSVVVGFILFVVPGLIMIRRYYLASYFMIDKNLSPREAMRQSAASSKQASGYIWGLLGVSFVLGITSVVPLIGGVISTLLGAAYSVAPALRYQEIKNLATSGDK